MPPAAFAASAAPGSFPSRKEIAPPASSPGKSSKASPDERGLQSLKHGLISRPASPSGKSSKGSPDERRLSEVKSPRLSRGLSIHASPAVALHSAAQAKATLR